MERFGIVRTKMCASMGPGRGRDREEAMHTLERFLAGAALFAAAILLHTGTGMTADGDKVRSVSVAATGKVAAEPDIAYISAGVVSEADTAKEALARNSAAMVKVIAGLKSAGIDAKDIQTTTLVVDPRYTQAKEGRPSVINGYRVMNQVRLTVRDVKKLGEILDQAIALGANQINRISFDVAKAETLKDEARRQAMANAKRRAELYATAAGAQLGPVRFISEDVRTAYQPMPTARAAMSAEVPIEGGTRILEVEVHVTYELR
jgi:uncharacterized protein